MAKKVIATRLFATTVHGLLVKGEPGKELEVSDKVAAELIRLKLAEKPSRSNKSKEE